MSKPLFILTAVLIVLLASFNYYHSTSVAQLGQEPKAASSAPSQDQATNDADSLNNAVAETDNAAAAEAAGNTAGNADGQANAAVKSKVTGTDKAAIGGSFTLKNQDGNLVKDSDFRGKYMLVYFGFTNCPEICPTGLQAISQALVKLGELSQKIQPIFITVDAQRDTPTELKAYLSNFNPKIQGLTGTQSQIDHATKTYKVYAKKVENEMMGVMFDHSAFIYLMDKEGKYITHFRHNVAVNELTNGIKANLN